MSQNRHHLSSNSVSSLTSLSHSFLQTESQLAHEVDGAFLSL